MAKVINSQDVNEILSKKFVETYYGGVIHLPDRGVEEINEADMTASSVRFVRQTPPTGKARTIGATVNGGNYNSGSVGAPSSTPFEVPLTYLYDTNEDIPDVVTDMFDANLVRITGENIAGVVNRQINASTLATQIVASLNQGAIDSNANLVKLPQTATTSQYLDSIVAATVLLDNGDSANYVESFPTEKRQAIIRPAFYGKLFSTGNIIPGGSNYAQEMLARGVISPDTYQGNGGIYYKGDVLNIPCFSVPDAIWSEAEKWINVYTAAAGETPASTAAMSAGGLSGINGVVVSSIGTKRGIQMKGIVTQPSTSGHGLLIKPLYRWGVSTIYPKSVVVMTTYAFSNPAVYTTGAYVTKLEIQSPGTRE